MKQRPCQCPQCCTKTLIDTEYCSFCLEFCCTVKMPPLWEFGELERSMAQLHVTMMLWNYHRSRDQFLRDGIDPSMALRNRAAWEAHQRKKNVENEIGSESEPNTTDE